VCRRRNIAGKERFRRLLSQGELRQ